MVDSVTFRTTDNTRWGPGFGGDLSAAQIDINFWVLLTMVQALQATVTEGGAGIDHFVISGSNLFVHLTNHFVLGPYPLPVAAWNFRGAWTPGTAYQPLDVVTNGGAVYLVLLQHVSSTLFVAGANDGLGHNWYGLLLAAAPREVPAGSAAGQLLQWQSSPGDIRWVTPTRNLGFFIEGAPNPIEYIGEYMVPEAMSFPQGLTGTLFSSGTNPTTDQEYVFYQDGGPIGNVIFHSNGTQTVTFPHQIDFDVGDIFSIVAPSVPDPHMTRIRMTFVGLLP